MYQVCCSDYEIWVEQYAVQYLYAPHERGFHDRADNYPVTLATTYVKRSVAFHKHVTRLLFPWIRSYFFSVEFCRVSFSEYCIPVTVHMHSTLVLLCGRSTLL